MIAPKVGSESKGSMDQSKKTMRHFYCRDLLWETFEQMANDFDCSIDYLINEAMRYYATSKNYMGRQAGAPAPAARPAPPRAAASPAAAKPAAAAAPPAPAHRPAPPPPPGGGGSRRPAAPQGYGPRAVSRPLRVPQVPAQGSPPVLYLVFNTERIPIDKDQFIIGRGSKTSDLAIKDGNISRKHAAVIRRNGVYYIKDLGSTNGIDFKGMRIDNKRIEEGDVFHLCDYELRFTFKG